MEASFSPYCEFLGLAPGQVAPSYYRLLGLADGESNAAKITAGAERATVKVRGQRPGAHAAAWSALLDEIQVAKQCLLNDQQRSAYDAQLRADSEEKETQADPKPSPFLPPAQAKRPVNPAALVAPCEPAPTQMTFVPADAPLAAAFPPGMAPASAIAPSAAWQAPSQLQNPGANTAFPPGFSAPVGYIAPNPAIAHPAGMPSQHDPMAPVTMPQQGASPMQPFGWSTSGYPGAPSATAPYVPAQPQGYGPPQPQGYAADPMTPLYYGQVSGQPAMPYQPHAFPSASQQVGPQQPFYPQNPATYGGTPYGSGGAAVATAPMAMAVPMAYPAHQANSTYAAHPMGSSVAAVSPGAESASAPVELFAKPTVGRSKPLKGKSSGGPMFLIVSAVAALAAVGVLVAYLKMGGSPSSGDGVAANSEANNVANAVNQSAAVPATVPAAVPPIASKVPPVAPATGKAPPPTKSVPGKTKPAEIINSATPSADMTTEEEPADEPEAMVEMKEKPEAEIPSDAMPEKPAEDMPEDAKPTGGVTNKDLAELSKHMKQAKAALGDLNFTEAEQSLSLALGVAKLPEHEEKVRRLQNVAKLAEQFRESIRRTMSRLNAGEVIKIGSSTEAAIVEAEPEKLIIRINGQNKTYTLDDMPLGLAVNLGERSLDAASPNTRLMKGAYVFLDKRSDATQLKKAKTWWEEAQLNGVDLRSLMPVFTDSYDFTGNAQDAPETDAEAESDN